MKFASARAHPPGHCRDQARRLTPTGPPLVCYINGADLLDYLTTAELHAIADDDGTAEGLALAQLLLSDYRAEGIDPPGRGRMIRTCVRGGGDEPGARPLQPAPGERHAVWVVLEALNIRVPGTPEHVVIDGLDMTGQVRGLLQRWYKTVKGDWLATVTFAIPYADRHKGRLLLTDQLVPAYALRPREPDNKPV